jgi:tetratricopeptide (TPR) repeat protein
VATEQKESLLANSDAADFIRFFLFAKASRLAGHGQLRRAQQMFAQAEDASRRDGLSESQALAVCQRSWLGALLGGKTREKIDPASALAIAQSPDISVCVGDSDALAGNDSAAVKVANDLSRQRPHDTWVQSMFVPSILARIEINHGNGTKALDLLKPAVSYDLANAETLTLRGQAFLLNHQPQEAEKEFQLAKNLQNEGFQDPNAWLAQLYLARAYAMEGDKSKARAAYQDFLASWKDADPDLPLLATAKAEYAKLQ